MKRTLILLAASVIILMPWQSNAQMFSPDAMMLPGDDVMIQFCNRTKRQPVIFVATGSQTTSPSRVWLRGWWRVERGKCVNTALHAVGETWFYGQAPGGREWNRSDTPGASLCVKDGERFFLVADYDFHVADCPNGYRMASFGSFVTYQSDVNRGFFQPFID